MKRLLYICLALCLSACANWATPRQNCPPILPPLPSALWTQAITNVEAITLSHPEAGHHQWLVVSERSDAGLNLRGLNALGVDVFSLHYEHDVPEVQVLGGIDPAFDFRVLVADYQFVHWPLTTLQAGLPKHWQIDEDDQRRSLSCGGELISTVEYVTQGEVSGLVRLSNHKLGYTLELQEISAQR